MDQVLTYKPNMNSDYVPDLVYKSVYATSCEIQILTSCFTQL